MLRHLGPSIPRIFYFWDMKAVQNQVLNAKQTLQKIKRIAHEIYEDNFKEECIVFAGIEGMGYTFAKILKAEFEKIAPIKCELIHISLDKTAPLQSEITLDAETSIWLNKTIILTDDVLNTGKTLAYSLNPFLTNEIKRLQTAVIVDRGHKDFPISADYVGYSLSTTIQERIQVILEGKNIGVYLH